jgi:hypothetical protein
MGCRMRSFASPLNKPSTTYGSRAAVVGHRATIAVGVDPGNHLEEINGGRPWMERGFWRWLACLDVPFAPKAVSRARKR